MRFPIDIPFVQRLGFELLSMGEGEAELAVTVDESLLNSFGVAHGGLVMTLLDVAMAHAARSVGSAQDAARSAAPAGETASVVTIEMKTSFMRPGEGRLVAQGKLLHRTATLAFCEGRVRGAQGDLCAHATATFKYLRALPTAARGMKTPTGHLVGPGSD